MNPTLRLIVFAVAIVVSWLGYTANSILLLLTGLLVLAWVFHKLGDTPALTQGTSELTLRQALALWRAHTALTLGLAAVSGSILAAWLAARDPFSLFANYLWLASLLLIVLAAWRYDGLGRHTLRAWLAQWRQRAWWGEAALVVVLTLVAFVLRAYDLEHFPPPMHGDEGEIGMLALRVLEGKEPLPLFATSWGDLPNALFYFKAIALALFGKTEVGLRLLSALFGTASVPCLYLLGRMGWGRLAGFVAAWLMAVSHLHIHYSRLGLNIVEVAFALQLCVLMLARAREEAKSSDAEPTTPPKEMLAWYVGVGLMMTLAQYIYYGARLMPFVVAPLLLYTWRERRTSLKQIAVVGVACFVAFAPMAYFYVNHPNLILGRTTTVNIFTDESVRHALGAQASLSNDWLPLLQLQVERTLGFLVRRGDASDFYLQDLASFDALTVLLMWLGLGVVLTQPRRYHAFALWLWFGWSLLLGGVLTIDPPSAQRLLIVTPCVYLLGGFFVARALQLVRASIYVRHAVFGLPILVAGLLATLAFNLQTYFVDYSRAAHNLPPIMIAREMSITPQQYHAYLLAAPNLYASHGVLRFVARDAQAKDLLMPNDLPPPNADGKGVLIVALPARTNDLRVIEARFPGGTRSSYTDPLGRPIYVAYRIPPRASP